MSQTVFACSYHLMFVLSGETGTNFIVCLTTLGIDGPNLLSFEHHSLWSYATGDTIPLTHDIYHVYHDTTISTPINCARKKKILITSIACTNFLSLLSGPSWTWSYGSWIYNYLCNQYLSALKLWVRTPFMARCIRYNIMWYSSSLTCDR